jgi:DNA-directed RNA polymerase specialized sigma24 family protein
VERREKERRIGPESFEEFFARAERPIRYALCARFGFEVGREATAEALAYAWEHWDRVSNMENAVGYVYRVGQRLGSRMSRRRDPILFAAPVDDGTLDIEPRLGTALSRLSSRQRTVVVMIHGLGWTHLETATFLGISTSSVQKHGERALNRLRSELGVDIAH